MPNLDSPKTILVTGSTDGIGLATARGLERSVGRINCTSVGPARSPGAERRRAPNAEPEHPALQP